MYVYEKNIYIYVCIFMYMNMHIDFCLMASESTGISTGSSDSIG
jgi:hypothetical protein